MRLVRDEKTHVIERQDDARTEVDQRLRVARFERDEWPKLDRACKVELERMEDQRDYLKNKTCPKCGVSQDILAGHGALERVRVRVGNVQNVPRNQHSACGFSEFIDEQYLRECGASRKGLDAAGIRRLVKGEFVAVWFLDEVRVDHGFMAAVRQHRPPAEFSLADSFSVATIMAASLEDALEAAQHESFDPAWRTAMPVDAKLRPLKDWRGFRNATDKAALSEAKAERARQTKDVIDREIELLRRARYAQAGI